MIRVVVVSLETIVGISSKLGICERWRIIVIYSGIHLFRPVETLSQQPQYRHLKHARDRYSDDNIVYVEVVWVLRRRRWTRLIGEIGQDLQIGEGVSIGR